MFKVLRVVFILTIGLYIGFQLSMVAMRSQCDAAGGDWTGRMCVLAEVTQ